jgi:hypothetical protein
MAMATATPTRAHTTTRGHGAFTWLLQECGAHAVSLFVCRTVCMLLAARACMHVSNRWMLRQGGAAGSGKSQMRNK